MFSPDSPLARPITDLFTVVLIIGAVILFIVVVWVLFAAIRYRARPGDTEEPRQIFGRVWMEIGWTAAPALILIGVWVLAALIGQRAADPPKPADASPDVIIIGHQWWWEYRYPNSGVLTANELHIPANTRLLAQVESADVIHDFWVPQLVRKIDAIPGKTNHIWLEPSRTGEYHGTCAEFCGAQHAWMRILIISESQADFDAWEKQQLQSPSIPAGSEAANGAQVFRELPCINCHLLTNAGPNLTHFGSRRTIGTGILTNTPENLYKWLANPQAVKPGIYMPDLRLTADEINALVAYLEASK
jgi:cytochrome c oxidase subunit 2